jgi:hypothetical protein
MSINHYFKEDDYEYLKHIIKILYSDYTIFLTGKFFNKNKCFDFKKNLLTYLAKYNIVYLNYEEKDKVINILSVINNFIKNTDDKCKDEFMNNFLLNNYSRKLKQIYFLENSYEPNVLYKKIKFSNQHIFIPFDQYIIKKMEYKLRTFCQIAEKLGAEKIIIEYHSSNHEENNIRSDLNFMLLSIGLNRNTNKENDEKVKIEFEYPNNHSDINLNKFFIIDSILNENEFLITKEEFESDLELKFLIDTRCVNFIQKYNTNFIMNHINKIEQKIFMKAHNYGLNIGNLSLKNNYINISISIDFVQIYNNIDIIDGTNIHVLREGFTYLANIIKKNEKYEYILRFLQSHLNAIEKRWILLNYEYESVRYINKIYHNIIDLNFKEEEICTFIKDFFKNNLTWHNFKKFRDIILLGSDDQLEKIYFISFQYHDIMNNKKHIINDINKYIDYLVDNFIIKKNDDLIDYDNETDIEIYYNESSDINEDYNLLFDFIKNNKMVIKNILYETFRKSFKYINGLSDNLTNIDKLIIVIKNIINYYYDNEIKNLQAKFSSLFNIKKIFFDKIIEDICNEIIKNLNILDTSPSVNIIENNEKESLHARTQKIFLKFIIKFFDFENNIHKITNKLGLENDMIEAKILLPCLNKLIPINKTYKNYNRYKVFYTWDDFLFIKQYFVPSSTNKN